MSFSFSSLKILSVRLCACPQSLRWKFDLDGPDVSREYLRVGSERIPLDPVNSSASLSIITALKVRTVRAAKSIGFEDGKEEARTLFGNETVVGTMLLRGWLPSAIFDDSSLRLAHHSGPLCGMGRSSLKSLVLNVLRNLNRSFLSGSRFLSRPGRHPE